MLPDYGNANCCERNSSDREKLKYASGHDHQSVGEARYGNDVENVLSLAGTLSVQRGSAPLSQYAPVAVMILPNIAESPASTTSSDSFLPPHPLARAHESQPAVAAL